MSRLVRAARIAGFIVRSAFSTPVQQPGQGRAPRAPDQRSDFEGLDEFMGFSLDEMREVADKVPQIRDQYTSRTSINPRAVAHSLQENKADRRAVRIDDPDAGNPARWQTQQKSFEEMRRDVARSRAGAHPLNRIGKGDRGDGYEP